MASNDEPRRGRVDRSRARRIHQHELDTANRLANLGEDVTFIPANHDPRCDAYLSDGKEYEFKSPTGSNLNTILDKIKDAGADGKENFVLDLSRSAITLAEVDDLARYAIDNYPGVHRIRIIGRETSAGPRDITVKKGGV